MTTETSVPKKPQSEIVKPTPQEIQEVFRHCESEDYELSCLHLIQGVDSSNFRGLEAGDWVESTTGEKATGKEFTYVQSFKERVVWWARENSKGEKGLYARFGANETVPTEILANVDLEVIDTQNLFVLLGDERIPAVIRLKRTALKAGRNINSGEKRRLLNGQPAGVYALQADIKTSDQYSWFVPLFVKVRDATLEETQRVLEAREFLRTTQARVRDADGSTDQPHIVTNGKKLSEVEKIASESLRKKHEPVDESSIPF